MKEKSKHWFEYDRNKPIDNTPHYYKGMVYGYKAFDIIEDYRKAKFYLKKDKIKKSYI